ncbi:MAG TPA: hypothetical protein VGD81_07495 [Opitutaceae bacterium]
MALQHSRIVNRREAIFRGGVGDQPARSPREGARAGAFALDPAGAGR